MDRLWAPWRIKYVGSKAKRKTGCIFCRQKDYVVFRSPLSVAMLNIYPYNNGHCMVSPARHAGTLSALREDELVDLMRTLELTRRALDKALKPHGYNIGINVSKSAGAGITGHLHIHIVPRWLGDTNFMPALYGTKVISQSLEELRGRLIKLLGRGAKRRGGK